MQHAALVHHTLHTVSPCVHDALPSCTPLSPTPVLYDEDAGRRGDAFSHQHHHHRDAPETPKIFHCITTPSPGERARRTGAYQRRWPLPVYSALVAQMLAKPMLCFRKVYPLLAEQRIRARVRAEKGDGNTGERCFVSFFFSFFFLFLSVRCSSQTGEIKKRRVGKECAVA